MTTINATFGSVTAGPLTLVKSGQTIKYSLTGTFVGTLQLVKSGTGGNTWDILLTRTMASGDTLIIENKDTGDALVGWRCTAYTSGSAITSITNPAIPEESTTEPLTQGSRLLIAVGDSVFAGGNTVISGLTIAVANNVATVTNATNHGLWPDAEFYLAGPDQYAAWGRFTALTRTDANGFTFQVPDTYPHTVTGTTISLVHQGQINDRNYIALACAQMDWPIGRIYNHAASGMRSDQALMRFDQDVLAYNPEIVYIQVGTNDAFSGISDLVIKDNITTRVVQALNAGARVILGLMPPIGPSATNYTAARARIVMRVNRYLREWAQQYERVRVLDGFGRVTTIADADWLSGYSADDTHPNGTAAREISDDALTILQGWYPNGFKRISTLIDRVSSDSSNRQIWTNPTFSGSTASPSGAFLNSCTGTIADNLLVTETGSGSCVLTAGVTRTDRRGFDQQLVFTAAAASDALDLLGDSVHTSVTAGDKIRFWTHMTGTSITNLARMIAWLDIVIDGNTYSFDCIKNVSGSYLINRDFNYYLQSDIFTVPAGSVTTFRPRWQWLFAGAGGATLKIGCTSIERLEL